MLRLVHPDIDVLNDSIPFPRRTEPTPPRFGRLVGFDEPMDARVMAEQALDDVQRQLNALASILPTFQFDADDDRPSAA